MSRRGQAMLEYLLLLSLFAALSFAAFKGGLVQKTLQTANEYFKTGARAITGGYTNSDGSFVRYDPKPIDGGWCAWTECINGYHVRECACPRAVFGGASCPAGEPASEKCEGQAQNVTCAGGLRYIPGVGCGCYAGETYNGTACVAAGCTWGDWGACSGIGGAFNSGTQTRNCTDALGTVVKTDTPRKCCAADNGWNSVQQKCVPCQVKGQAFYQGDMPVCKTCSQIDDGNGGKLVWNDVKQECVCADGTEWKPGTKCEACKGGKIPDGLGGCSCPAGTSWDPNTKDAQNPDGYCVCPALRTLSNGAQITFACPANSSKTLDRCGCVCEDCDECTSEAYVDPVSNSSETGTCTTTNISRACGNNGNTGTCHDGQCACDDNNECTGDSSERPTCASGGVWNCVFDAEVMRGVKCGAGDWRVCKDGGCGCKDKKDQIELPVVYSGSYGEGWCPPNSEGDISTCYIPNKTEFCAGGSCGTITVSICGETTTYSCDDCPANQECDPGTHKCIECKVPTQTEYCDHYGFKCGDHNMTVVDNCGASGGVMNCGSCSGAETCGGGGTANVCGCTSTGCNPSTVACGTSYRDNCDHSCGMGTACPSPQTCGGGGTANVCG